MASSCPELELLACRDKILRAVRAWFHDNGFIEVQTPVMVDEAAPEAFIDTFRLSETGQPFICLAPSPELRMKRIIACGASRIFQICPAFRRDEIGRLHLPEFTMLEWYRSDAGYLDIMRDCEGITAAAAVAAGSSVKVPFQRFRIKELFIEYAGWDPFASIDSERFNHDMSVIIEPSLPMDPLFIYDYPCTEASLAALKSHEPSIAERTEFYMGRTELANGFTELIDPDEQRKRFEKENRHRKNNGLEPYPMPERFLDAIRHMPRCAGMALGIDRLIMLLSGASSVDEVIAFPVTCQ